MTDVGRATSRSTAFRPESTGSWCCPRFSIRSGCRCGRRRYKFTADKTNELDLSIPSPERIANAICPSAQRMRGPAVMVGFVRDPDTKEPAIGSKVQLVFNETDLIGRPQPRVREATVDSSGLYKICGLPGRHERQGAGIPQRRQLGRSAGRSEQRVPRAARIQHRRQARHDGRDEDRQREDEDGRARHRRA